MQLIRIKTTPIEYQIKVQKAELKMDPKLPKSEYQRTPAKMEIRQKNISMRMDSTAMRESLGIKTSETAARDRDADGAVAIKRATEEYVQIGNEMAKAYKGASIPDIMYNKLFQQPTTHQVFLPSVGPQISWDPAQLDLNYTPAKMDYKWDVGKAQFEYVPGSISVDITQYPSIEFEYLGGPRYVPASADPNYKE